MEGIDNNYIENTITTLVSTIGIKDHVDGQELVSLIHSKKVKEGIKEIAEYLGLPIEIDLSYVSKEYKANNTNNFNSTHVVKTDWKGRGNGGITAQVLIPGNFPLYGTSGLNNFPISVRISENCTDNALTFIAVMAHELSHVVLHSLWHKEKDNEIYTDITAMILGFSVIINNGRKVVKTIEKLNSTETQTTTYGYLSDEQFRFAYDKIEKILDRHKKNKNSFNKKIKELGKKLRNKKNMILYFQKYLEYLDQNLNQKISQHDGIEISAFHQAGYIDEFSAIVWIAENKLRNFILFIQDLNHYDEDRFQQIKRYEEEIKLLNTDLNSKYNKLSENINILKKYTSIIYRLKLFFKIHFGK